MKTIKLGEVFDDQDLWKARKIYRETKTQAQLLQRLVEEVVQPKMDHINFVTCQENDARYFAYVLVHALSRPQKEREDGQV